MIRRVIRYLVALGSAAVLACIGALASPLIWPAHPDASLQMRDGHLVGEVVGYVWHADPSTATIKVSASPVGLRAFPFVVGEDTRITDGGKEGAFGDLTKHARVRLRYEPRPNGRMASSIEVLHQGTAGLPTPPRDERATQGAAGYWVEVGVFAGPDAAAALATRLLEHHLTVALESVTLPRHQQPALRVQIGPFADGAAARAAQQILRASGYQARALW